MRRRRKEENSNETPRRWLSRFPFQALQAIYNLNFTTVVFKTLVFSLRLCTQSHRVDNFSQRFFLLPPLQRKLSAKLFRDVLQQCYSNKYTKLNQICIEIGLKTLFRSHSLVVRLFDSDTEAKAPLAIRIAFQHLLAWTFISFDVAVLFNLIWWNKCNATRLRILRLADRSKISGNCRTSEEQEMRHKTWKRNRSSCCQILPRF